MRRVLRATRQASTRPDGRLARRCQVSPNRAPRRSRPAETPAVSLPTASHRRHLRRPRPNLGGEFGNRLMHQRRDPALARVQVTVAARHGEAICFPDRRRPDDLERQIEIAHHLPYDGELLEIFLPNTAMSGATCRNSLAHTVATPPKKCGRKSLPRPSAAPAGTMRVANPSGYISRTPGAHKAAPGASELGDIVVEGSRIARKSSFGANWVGLTKIDDDAVAGLERKTHQRDVAVMERTHGWDQPDPVASRRHVPTRMRTSATVLLTAIGCVGMGSSGCTAPREAAVFALRSWVAGRKSRPEGTGPPRWHRAPTTAAAAGRSAGQAPAARRTP